MKKKAIEVPEPTVLSSKAFKTLQRELAFARGSYLPKKIGEAVPVKNKGRKRAIVEVLRWMHALNGLRRIAQTD